MDIHNLYDLPRPEQVCFICSVQRSGSNWLSNALAQTGIAGKPVEHFNPNSMTERRKIYQLEEDDFAGMLRLALQLSMTPNGVCSIKFMYQQMVWLVNNLRTLTGDEHTPERELLEQFFPRLQFVYTYRRDKVRQGISAHKARQSRVYQWYASPERPDYAVGSQWHFSTEKPNFEDKVHFDVKRIDLMIEQGILRFELEWQQFFQRNQIKPFTMVYEDFVDRYAETLRDILAYLGLSWPDDQSVPQAVIQRVSDEINEAWYAQYMSEHGWLADGARHEVMSEGEYAGALLERLAQLRKGFQGTLKHRDAQIAQLEAEITQAQVIHQQQVHTPDWVRDHIPWRVLVAALARKVLRR